MMTNNAPSVARGPSEWPDVELLLITTRESFMTDPDDAFVTGMMPGLKSLAPHSVDAVRGISPSALMLSSGDPSPARPELSLVSTLFWPSCLSSLYTCPDILSLQLASPKL